MIELNPFPTGIYLHIDTDENINRINELIHDFLLKNRSGYNANSYIVDPLKKKDGGFIIPLPNEYGNPALLQQFMEENANELYLFGGSIEEIDNNITLYIEDGTLIAHEIELSH